MIGGKSLLIFPSNFHSEFFYLVLLSHLRVSFLLFSLTLSEILRRGSGTTAPGGPYYQYVRLLYSVKHFDLSTFGYIAPNSAKCWNGQVSFATFWEPIYLSFYCSIDSISSLESKPEKGGRYALRDHILHKLHVEKDDHSPPPHK